MKGKSVAGKTDSNHQFLLGNEAIARGAIEANVAFVAGYPGTPSSEILQTVVAASQLYGIHVEWSTNEDRKSTRLNSSHCA